MSRNSVVILVAVSTLVIVIVTVVLVTQLKDSSDAASSHSAIPPDYLDTHINPESIRGYLRHLTRKPHIGGTPAEWETANWVADTWRNQGLDEVHLVPYHVLLSYPKNDTPNLVRILSGGEIVWESAGRPKALYASEESRDDVPFTFIAYSAPANITGKPVYAYYGRKEDYKVLEDAGVSIKGKIVLARYGKVFRGNIVQLAERLGAAGVVLIHDPDQYAPFGTSYVYPNSVMLPPTGVAEGTSMVSDGDPLTPFYPSTEGAFHIPEDEALLPRIPVQSLSYEDAWHIMSRMGGATAPDEWQGGFNFTYHLGPGMTNPRMVVNMDIHTHNVPTITYNVIGVMKGSVEPDRYVGLGNHRDAWIFGGVDPSSGTAAMLELSRVFTQLQQETGWRPRRSLVFCSWGSEEYGLIGSMEWAEQFEKQLGNRMVGYLNLDLALNGNYSLTADSAPLMYDIAWTAAKHVSNPDPNEVASGHKTVFDTWVYRQPDSKRPGYPQMNPIASGSDYKGFQHLLGIPSCDCFYKQGNETIGYPLYHTLYETFALMDEFYDRGFHFHKAVAAVWGEMAILLAESEILPLSLTEYVKYIQDAQADILTTYGDMLATKNITMDYFLKAGENFNSSVNKFLASLSDLDRTNPLAVRHVNDQLMMVERAFIDPRGLPHRPEYRHVVVATSTSDAYSASAFAGLTDALEAVKEGDTEEEVDSAWRDFSQHLGAVTHWLNTASKVLTDDLW